MSGNTNRRRGGIGNPARDEPVYGEILVVYTRRGAGVNPMRVVPPPVRAIVSIYPCERAAPRIAV